MLNNIGQEQPQATSGSFWRSPYNWLILLLLLGTIVTWIVVNIKGTKDAEINYIYSLLLGVIPFVASFKGFVTSKRWGGLSSVLGRSIAALSAGLLLWGAGELIWSYYNLILKVPAPYPSIADIPFTFNYIFWVLSALFLSKLAGVNLVLKKKPSLWLVVGGLTTASIAVSYYLFVVLARQGQLLSDSSNALKIFLDTYYPLADFLSFTTVIVITVVAGRYLGGKLKLPIFLFMAGLAVMYAGDVIFGYTTTVGSFFNADAGDLVLLLGTNLMVWSLLTYSQTVPRAPIEAEV